MTRLLVRLVTTLCVMGFFALPAPMARAQSGPDLFDLLNLAQSDPQAALEQTDAVLRAIEAEPETDQRTLFDLYVLRADLAEQTGDLAAAADAYARLAQFAMSAAADPNGPNLDEDPVALWSHAARLAEAAGNLRMARRYLEAKLAAQVDRNVMPDAVAATYTALGDIADALGDPETGAELRQKATSVLVMPMSADPTRGDDPGYRAVDVYYATDRARTGAIEPDAFYGSDRAGALDLGVATVTIPNSHTSGLLEAPSVWKLEFAPNPSKHVVLQSVTPMDEDGFFGRLQGEFADGVKSEAFVFVHGYNVKFDQAARRAAQIAHDMEYPGVPILYSWPSRGMTVAYVADSAVVRLSGRRLADFLEDLVNKSGARTLHIVGHSMGNRALTDALEIMALKRRQTAETPPVFGQILFAAPDVDAGLFAAMIRTIRPLAERLTLYASEKDWALVSSRKLHGNAPRAGQGGIDTLADVNVDSIDMSELGDDMLAHSYFADDSSALADMVTLFWKNTDPDRRCGLAQRPTEPGGAVTWQYKRGECATGNLIDAMAHLRDADVSSLNEALSVLTEAAPDAALRTQLVPVITRILQP